MPRFLFFFIIAGLIFFFVSKFVLGKKARFRRRLKKIPLKKIPEVKEGEYVRIVGRIRSGKTELTAPLTGRSCNYYQIKVEEHEGGEHGSWEERIKEHDGRNFFLETDQGIAHIDVGFAHCYLVQDAQYKSGFLNDATPRLESLLNDYGYKSTGFLGFNRKIRYYEGILEPGEEVVVAGYAHWVKNEYKGLPRSNNKVVKLEGTAQRELLISDEPGMIDYPPSKEKEDQAEQELHERLDLRDAPESEIQVEETPASPSPPTPEKEAPQPEKPRTERKSQERNERKSERPDTKRRKGRYLK